MAGVRGSELRASTRVPRLVVDRFFGELEDDGLRTDRL
jgi:hypothetical protein